MNSLEIRLFGPFDVRLKGEPLRPLRSRKGQWILALLALRHDREVARALFGPSVSLLTVIGAQRQNAALALGSLAVLAGANLALAPLYGVLGASIAVAVATLTWLIASAIVLARFDGLRTDAVYLLRP